eukprot:TRINITY_DN229_c6_g1_i1.p1 TRINITY_DN229_c6_g1~~TRINITY_DN229_c6_g1_i1.p1  ORF type:complete len:329 (+),score=101.01 TRINITY_DN229_c6_g1_i1:135-1121(+)
MASNNNNNNNNNNEDNKAIVNDMDDIGGFNHLLHPLIIVNITDHYTREKVRNDTDRVFGALLGTLTGKDMNIITTFELNITNAGIDETFLIKKLEQLKEVKNFQYGLLGWYSTGSDASELDLEVHQQFMKFLESPIYVMLDIKSAEDGKASKLPCKLYTSELTIVNDTPKVRFRKSTYKVASGESERIAVNVASKDANFGNEADKILTQLQGTHNSISMLNIRIQIVENYLSKVIEGSIEPNYEVLRKIKTMCAFLPTIKGQTFTKDYLSEYNDALLTMYLASITTGTNAANQVANTFSSSLDSKHNMFPQIPDIAMRRGRGRPNYMS